jgi:hypothetical protein
MLLLLLLLAIDRTTARAARCELEAPSRPPHAPKAPQILILGAAERHFRAELAETISRPQIVLLESATSHL